MTTDSHHKIARDRFVAFAFASADFLLEIDKAGKIVFTAGKLKSLTGQESAYWLGRDWLALFSKTNHDNLKALLKGVQRAGRVGPLVLDIVDFASDKTSKAMAMGMTIPESPNIFLSMNTTEAFFDFLEVQDFKDSRLLDEKQFEESAIKAFSAAKRDGKSLDITFLEAGKIEEYKKSLSVDEANSFNDSLNAVLKEQSFEGNTASQVDDNKYAIIHDTAITPEFIERKIQELVKRTTPTSTDGVGLKSKTIEADLDVLSEREARRALVYTMNQIEKKGLDVVGGNLKQGFDDYLQENATKITNLKKIVGQQAFKLHYQPIVHLPGETICHYEALVRFDDGDTPYELITFGEDIGLAPDIDLSILRQAIGYIQNNLKKNNSLRIAVNVSGQSIQSAKFFEAVLETLEETNCSPDNLMFEITESTQIENLEQVNSYIQKLRKKKYEVCLDDFGAGSASFQYLNALDIDCVKIDGKYVRDAINSPRDEAMVRNLVRMCKDLNVTTIAEMVETQQQLDYMNKIGVDKAQGWLFGRPAAKAEYNKR